MLSSSLHLLITMSQPSETDVSSDHSFETFQPAHQPNPYLDPSLNNATFFPNSAGFQQPVR